MDQLKYLSPAVDDYKSRNSWADIIIYIQYHCNMPNRLAILCGIYDLNRTSDLFICIYNLISITYSYNHNS